MTHLTPETLNLYLDDQLDANARAEIQAHLAICADCRHALAELSGIFTSLASLAAIEPERIPVDLAPRVLEHIVTRRAWSPLALGLLIVQLLFAGGLVFVVLPALLTQPLTNLFALPNPPLVEPPTFLLNWRDALVFAFQDSLASLMRLNSFPPIDTVQWLIAIGVMGIVWLVSNRVLLSKPNGARENKPEAV